MAGIPIATALLISAGATAATTAVSALSKPKTQQPLSAPTRNMAADAARQDDALRKRRGAGANEITGGGAEAASPGGKTLLGQ